MAESEHKHDSVAANPSLESTLPIDSPSTFENYHVSSTPVEINNGVESKKCLTNCSSQLNGVVLSPVMNSSSISEIVVNGSTMMNLDSLDASEAKSDEFIPQVPVTYNARNLGSEKLQKMAESEVGGSSSGANRLSEGTLLIDSLSTLENYQILSSNQVEINNGVELEKCSIDCSLQSNGVVLTPEVNSILGIVLNGSTRLNLDSLDVSEAKSDKSTPQPINYKAKTLGSENLKQMAESEAGCSSSGANRLSEGTILIDSLSMLENYQILSSNQVEINKRDELEKCSMDYPFQSNGVVLSPVLNSISEIVLNGCMGMNLDSLVVSEAKSKSDKFTSQVPINYNAKTLGSETLQKMAESEDGCSSSGANLLSEGTILTDSLSTLENCQTLSSNQVEINNGVELEECSIDCSLQSNGVVLFPVVNSNPMDIDGEDSVNCLMNLDLLDTSEAKLDELLSNLTSEEYLRSSVTGSALVDINGTLTRTEVNGMELDALAQTLQTINSDFGYNDEAVPVDVNGTLTRMDVRGMESDTLAQTLHAINSDFGYNDKEVPVDINGTSTRMEVNGTESEVVAQTLHTINSNFGYNDEEVSVDVNDTSRMEVNDTELDALAPTVHAVSSDCGYNDEEVPVSVNDTSTRVEVDGTKSDAMAPTLHAVSSDVGYNDEEVSVGVNDTSTRVGVKDTSTRVEVNGTKSDALAPTLHAVSSNSGYNGEVPVPLPLMTNEPNLSCRESVPRSPRFTMGESISTTKSTSENRSVVGKRLEQSPSRRSPRLSFSAAMVVGTLDSEQSLENKALSERCARRSPRLSPVTSQAESAGRNKRGRFLQTCVRRSPRLSPIPLNEPKLKRFKSSVEESNVKVVDKKFLRSCELKVHVCKNNDVEAKPVSVGAHDKNVASMGNNDNEKLRDKCIESTQKLFADFENGMTEKESTINELHVSGHKKAPKIRSGTRASSNKKQRKQKRSCIFIGEPVPEDEAQERWGWRYELKGQRRVGQSWILNAGEEDEVHLNVQCHYLQANVDGCIFNLGDCAHIKGDGKQVHVGRILEFFKTSDDENYFRVQWFFRAEDTVMKQAAALHDKKRLFFSTLTNDNLLECILSKIKVIEITPALGLQSSSIQRSEYYCDMEYNVKYSTFRNLVTATDSGLDAKNVALMTSPLDLSNCEPEKAELALLDLYAGCGGMSTGLCLGAKLSGVNLVTRWAIDYHKLACDSLKANHPETQVRHTTAEDFLELLKEWEKLCKRYVLDDPDRMFETGSDGTKESRINESSPSDAEVAPGEYEVSSLVDICYGDPSRTGEHGLKFKVRWKGYDPSEDTWELIEGLSDCQDHIRKFVRSGYKSKILPCPGDVDIICGGPPCQGISGYNRFRNTDDPLTDERNQQIVVYFDIVKFLRPKYVLMENVADILRFDKASLGRYALSRLVHMNYQARLGIMAAGSYGLPQFRLRVFLWGALPSERLPQFPLPTHEVIVRYFPPAEFEQNTVAYDEGQPRELEEAIVLRDAISDLPPVTSHEDREEMAYEMPPQTEFQKYIRSTKDEMTGSAIKGVTDWRSSDLTDHRTYKLSEDDYERVCRVPRRKGANFRDFPGIVVGADNIVRRDPKLEPVLLPSGKPLIPDYVFTFEKGKSKRPFARVWWDENVATVVTFPNLHSQAAVHPEQDRVFTLREYARLQGFPDYYRFCGSVKERYCQVGNAVAVSVSKTLGYALGMAFRKLSGNEALMTLPPKFAFQVPPTPSHDFSAHP